MPAPHTFADVGDKNTVMLNTFTPYLYVQYFRGFKTMIDSGQPVNAETMKPLWKNYATAAPFPGRWGTTSPESSRRSALASPA